MGYFYVRRFHELEEVSIPVKKIGRLVTRILLFFDDGVLSLKH